MSDPYLAMLLSAAKRYAARPDTRALDASLDQPAAERTDSHGWYTAHPHSRARWITCS